MRRVILFLVLAQIPLIQYGQIIADHTIVDKYDKIPQQYIDIVKKMWLVVAGESHSQAYRTGLLNLETAYPSFAVSVVESGTPEPYTTSNLRASRATWGDYDNGTGWIYSYGEEDWFTSTLAKTRTKAGITYCNTNSLLIAAIGFGWCWDEAVNYSTYISATDEYVAYCATNGYSTKVFFTTGTVDDYTGTETGYNKYLNYESIRNHVLADPTRILFDYADILCYDNNGTLTTSTWNGHVYPDITNTNLNPESAAYHISEAGALRLAKAMWWMLARIAGWDGNSLLTGVTKTDELEGSEVVVETGSEKIRINSSDKFINGKVSLYSLNGNLIESRDIYDNISYIDTSLLPSGFYLVMLLKDNSREVKKIVLLR